MDTASPRLPSRTKPFVLTRIPTEVRFQIVQEVVLANGISSDIFSEFEFASGIDRQALALLHTCTTIRSDAIAILCRQRTFEFSKIHELRVFTDTFDDGILRNIRNIKLNEEFAEESFNAFETEFCDILRTKLTGVDRMLILGMSYGYIRLDHEGQYVLDGKLIAVRHASPKLAKGKMLLGRQTSQLPGYDRRRHRRSLFLTSKNESAESMSIWEPEQKKNAYLRVLWVFKETKVRVGVILEGYE